MTERLDHIPKSGCANVPSRAARTPWARQYLFLAVPGVNVRYWCAGKVHFYSVTLSLICFFSVYKERAVLSLRNDYLRRSWMTILKTFWHLRDVDISVCTNTESLCKQDNQHGIVLWLEYLDDKSLVRIYKGLFLIVFRYSFLWKDSKLNLLIKRYFMHGHDVCISVQTVYFWYNLLRLLVANIN